ncbi:MAG: hypothetical protein FMNOHCHN_03394 [Ignavibacteriaceae bacterium]|nr:hypothetical protein [Ignavibacteriaceae bacterium]
MKTQIKCLCIDLDGVVFGEKLYDKSGVCIGKMAKDQTWTAIKRFRAAGIPVIALTGDPWNEDILCNRKIPYEITRGKHKEDFIPKVCKTYKVSREEIAYIGDDLFDMGVLTAVGWPFCPSDATEECKSVCWSNFLKSKGGENILMELFYWCRERGLIPHLPFEEEYKKILSLDEHEKF